MSKHKEQESDSLIKSVAKLLQTLAELMNEMVELAALELRLAGKSLILIIGLYIAVVFLFMSGWFLLLVTVGYGLVLWLKMSWITAFGLLALANFLLIIPALMWVARARVRLTFPATRKQLHLYKEGER